MPGLDSAGEAGQEGPGGVGAALQGWTLRGVSNSWLPSLNNAERTALRPALSRGAGLRGLKTSISMQSVHRQVSR